MKKMGLGEIWTVLVVLGMLVSATVAGVTDKKLTVLGAEEAALWDATHVLEINYNDFVGLTTSTNTTTTITNALPAGTLVRFQCMKLDQAFDCATYTDSLLIYSGWAADADGYFTSTEIAADGTEVWSAVTPIVQSEGTTVLYRATWPWQYCTSDTNLLTTFKQNSYGSCISSNTAGKVRFFWKLVLPRGEP
jgi:hypothetical protein